MAMSRAQNGITKAADLTWLDLPPGMGGGYPIAEWLVSESHGWELIDVSDEQPRASLR